MITSSPFSLSLIHLHIRIRVKGLKVEPEILFTKKSTLIIDKSQRPRKYVYKNHRPEINIETYTTERKEDKAIKQYQKTKKKRQEKRDIHHTANAIGCRLIKSSTSRYTSKKKKGHVKSVSLRQDWDDELLFLLRRFKKKKRRREARREGYIKFKC